MLKMKYYGRGRRKCAIAQVYMETTPGARFFSRVAYKGASARRQRRARPRPRLPQQGRLRLAQQGRLRLAQQGRLRLAQQGRLRLAQQGQKIDKSIKISDKNKSLMNETSGVSSKRKQSMVDPGLASLDIIINQKKSFDYFQNDQNFIQNIQQILKIFDQSPLYMKITVSGGGLTGQKEAIYLALARALRQSGLHSILKKKKLLTQDARRKERKKYGLKKARKAPQYSKR